MITRYCTMRGVWVRVGVSENLLFFFSQAANHVCELKIVRALGVDSAGRKKRRAARYDGDSGPESPMEEEQTDNAGALVQYQPQVDFTQHLADLLKQEPGVQPQPSTQPWVNGQSAPQGQHLTDVDSAFNSMNLANQVTISEDSNLSGGDMPQIPSASAVGVSVLEPLQQFV